MGQDGAIYTFFYFAIFHVKMVVFLQYKMSLVTLQSNVINKYFFEYSILFSSL
jgi:hypothetical protein